VTAFPSGMGRNVSRETFLRKRKENVMKEGRMFHVKHLILAEKERTIKGAKK
jgi:hypothetical protein